MISAKMIGALALGLPLLVLAWAFLWRRDNRPVFWFALAAIVVGLGYLTATGATEDIGRSVLGVARDAAVPAKAPAPAPAPAK